jgi:hypothetical protein
MTYILNLFYRGNAVIHQSICKDTTEWKGKNLDFPEVPTNGCPLCPRDRFKPAIMNRLKKHLETHIAHVVHQQGTQFVIYLLYL